MSSTRECRSFMAQAKPEKKKKKRRSLIRSRYKSEAGKAVIELRLRTTRQLFDERDPAPFRERDLDDDAVEYMVNAFRELSDHGSIKIKIHIADQKDPLIGPAEIKEALRSFFGYEAELQEQKLKLTFRTGRAALLMGSLFLLNAVFWGHFLGSLHDKKLIYSLLEEGLLLSGWVSMWKPIDLFLYSWWPIREAKKVYERLAGTEIDVFYEKEKKKPTTFVNLNLS